MPSTLARTMMQFQAFLLRRNWAGPMGDFVMVITTTGRKSGRRLATPIAYVRDGDSVLALSYPATNWYRNLRALPEALVEIRGKAIPVRAEFVDDEPGRAQVFEIFRRERPRQLKIFFGVPVDAPPDELARGVATRVFVRFRPRVNATA